MRLGPRPGWQDPVFGLMAYMVAWRRREIGIRRAIGATDVQIRRMVIRGGAVLALAGVAIGVAAAALGVHWLRPFLFQTAAYDPLVFGGVAATLVAVAIVAGWIPARRALAVEATEALRSE